MSRVAGFVMAFMLLATGVWAQEWRGSGRLMGKVVDDKGAAVEGVIVSASLPAFHGVLAQGKSDKKGEWTIDDVGEGNWDLIFEKDGFISAKGSSDVDENGRSSLVKTTLKKAFDPNAFIQEEGKKAQALMDQKKFAEARTVYEGISAKVPQVAGQMQQFVAQTYYLEGKPDKAAQLAKEILATDPGNAPVKLLLVGALLESGSIDEAAPILKSIEDAKITDPAIYANFGLALMKKQQPGDAIQYLDKAVARFPQSPEAYYYRAKAQADLVNAIKDPKDPARIEKLGKMKDDLKKFLALAPTSPGAEDAKNLLDQVEKMLAAKS